MVIDVPVDCVPDCFVLTDLGTGFGSSFGPVYMDRATARLGFRVADTHANPIGGLHGGALATFADVQLMAVRPGREEGRPHSPTISLSVDFIGPAAIGDWVEAAVVQVRATRTMMFTQAVISVNGSPIARSTAIYRIYDKTGE